MVPMQLVRLHQPRFVLPSPKANTQPSISSCNMKMHVKSLQVSSFKFQASAEISPFALPELIKIGEPHFAFRFLILISFLFTT